jgi:hypothetical protein
MNVILANPKRLDIAITNAANISSHFNNRA